MHVIHEPGLEILPNCGRAAKEPDVLVASRAPGSLQSGLDTIGDEVEYSTGPNMLRPMIQAPIPANPRAVMSSSVPASPPSLRCMA
jgi:hypothetical protein